jgi:antitoxin MazE
MQIAKWGNSLAVRLPAALVQALDLKEGEEINLHAINARTFEVSKKRSKGVACPFARISGTVAG